MSAKAKRSFEELALPHLEAVYRVARRLARDDHLAEDLVQETYLKAYKSFSSFEMREFGIKPWLFRILHNAFLNRLARDSRNPKATENSQLDALAKGGEFAPAGLSFAELDYEHLDEEVKRAIDVLSPEFRAVVLLWATMELSYQEIAEILDVPIGTVMSRLHRARQQLARTLHDYAREHRRIPAQDR